MNFNQLRDQAYGIAIAHGWHREEKSQEHWLAMIMTEVSEAVQADRLDYHARTNEYNERKRNYSNDRAFEVFLKNSVEDEMADIVIRCLDLAGLKGIDLIQFDGPAMKKALLKLKDYIKNMSFTEWAFEVATSLSAREQPLDLVLGEVISLTLIKSELMGVNLEWHIEKKMAYNEHRRYMHGKRY